jgi:hypothetical protein
VKCFMPCDKNMPESPPIHSFVHLPNLFLPMHNLQKNAF